MRKDLILGHDKQRLNLNPPDGRLIVTKHLFDSKTLFMKKLFLIFFFSGSLDSFSHDGGSGKIDTTQPLKKFDASKWGQPITSASIGPMTLQTGTTEWRLPAPTPDTLRAIVLVTLSPNGIAHARMGFVVISEGKRPVYLDCQKRALKLPQVGWGYQIVNAK